MPAFEEYVALGDSFTAAPFVPTTDVANGCFRSDGNYPSLVAARIDVGRLVDVSCSGADTGDLTSRQATVREATVPPQLSALSPRTDLVTLGIGGNDFSLFTTLVHTCTGLRSTDPQGSPCTDRLAAQGVALDQRLDRVGERVAAAVEEIRARSPQARVLLVGYPRIAPADGTCPQRLPFAAGDYELAIRVTRGLDRALRDAARSTGAEFVEMYAPSRGHSACSDQPWVNGQGTDRDAALAYHPLPAGQEAVADAVVEELAAPG